MYSSLLILLVKLTIIKYMKRKLEVYIDHIVWLGVRYNDQLDGCNINTFKDIINHIIDNSNYDYFEDIKEEIRDSYSWLYYPYNFTQNDKQLSRMTTDKFNKLIISNIETVKQEDIENIGIELIQLLYLN